MPTLTQPVYFALLDHARRAAPVEACGYLAEQGGVVAKLVRLTNAAAAPDRFALIPAEQFAAIRALRAAGYRVCGVYHSHPLGPPELSDADRLGATDPALFTLVVSLAGPVPRMTAFTNADGLREEAIRCIPSDIEPDLAEGPP